MTTFTVIHRFGLVLANCSGFLFMFDSGDMPQCYRYLSLTSSHGE